MHHFKFVTQINEIRELGTTVTHYAPTTTKLCSKRVQFCSSHPAFLAKQQKLVGVISIYSLIEIGTGHPIHPSMLESKVIKPNQSQWKNDRELKISHNTLDEVMLIEYLHTHSNHIEIFGFYHQIIKL